MPQRNSILNLSGFPIQKTYGTNLVTMEIHYRHKAHCIYCNHKKLRKKTSFIQQVCHESIGHRPILLLIKAYKFRCYTCQRYFNQRFPGIGKHQRATSSLHKQIFHQYAEGVSQQDLACNFKLGKATVERWYHRHYKLESREHLNRPCPQILVIDEHFFNKKWGFATIFCNLKKHKVYDLVKGHSASDLKNYLEKLPDKEKVKVICIDLSRTYRSLV